MKSPQLHKPIPVGTQVRISRNALHHITKTEEPVTGKIIAINNVSCWDIGYIILLDNPLEYCGEPCGAIATSGTALMNLKGEYEWRTVDNKPL